MIILVKAFGDEVLDRTKRELRRDLPQIGATVLDEYIAAHYEAAEQIGRHTILLRRSAH